MRSSAYFENCRLDLPTQKGSHKIFARQIFCGKRRRKRSKVPFGVLYKRLKAQFAATSVSTFCVNELFRAPTKKGFCGKRSSDGEICPLIKSKGKKTKSAATSKAVTCLPDSIFPFRYGLPQKLSSNKHYQTPPVGRKLLYHKKINTPFQVCLLF